MARSDMLILRGGIPPIRARKLLYYAMPAFKRRIMPPPEIDAHPLPATNIPAPRPKAPKRPPLANMPDEGANIITPVVDEPDTPAQSQSTDREMTDAEISGVVAIPADALQLDDIEVPRVGASEGEAMAFVEKMIGRAVGGREAA